MIKLFVTDLDGCISMPFTTPDWDAISRIRELNIKSRSDKTIPPLTICTGRPFPYAEAVAQWLDVRLPFVFESAGLYNWEGNRFVTAIDRKNGQLEPIRQMKRWLREDLLPRYPGAEAEFSKLMDAGVVCPDEEMISRIHKEILDKTESEFPDLEVYATEISVNVLLAGNNKLQGLKLLSQSLNISLSEMAYIGDSSGDVPALNNVEMPFSPMNARQVAKDHAEVLPQFTTKAVLEAYERIIVRNMESVG